MQRSGHVFIGHANTNLTLGQMAKYAFEKIILASMFEIFVYVCQCISGEEGKHGGMEKWVELKILLRRKMIGPKNKINLPVEKGDIKHHSPVSEIRG